MLAIKGQSTIKLLPKTIKNINLHFIFIICFRASNLKNNSILLFHKILMSICCVSGSV